MARCRVFCGLAAAAAVTLACLAVPTWASAEDRRGPASHQSEPGDSSHVESIIKNKLGFIDKMLEGHDRRAWPTYGTGQPTLVRVNIYVNSLSSISAANMEYSMDIYLRQSWRDLRLATGRYGINDTMTLNGEDIMDRIWRPDLFFRNVRSANFHKVTVPNMLIKMAPNGDVLYSMRLTLRLSCHMSFKHYPLDTQKCHVVLGSYAQTIDQVNVKWQRKDPIVIEKPVELPEFDLVSCTYNNFTRVIDTGAFSFLNATFTLQRQNGYHLVQTYLPTFLIVMISWVSFWLNVDATPARVTLGVTTLLTLTTVASGVRTQLPPVSYVKAIDVWIGACSVMVFGALLEFTLVNYLSRSKLKPEEFRKSINIFNPTKNSQSLSVDVGLTDFSPPTKSPDLSRPKKQANNSALSKEKPRATCGEDGDTGTDEETLNPAIRPSSTLEDLAMNLKRSKTVDRVCRVMFPVVFLVFNAVYWLYYLYVPDIK